MRTCVKLMCVAWALVLLARTTFSIASRWSVLPEPQAARRVTARRSAPAVFSTSGRGVGGLEQELGDLDRVQRRALDEVVAGEEEDQAAAVRGAVLADTTDEDVFGLSRRARGRHVDEPHPRRGFEERRRLRRRKGLLRLDPDRL